MIWAIGTPSAPERSLTVTPDSTVTGPVGCAGACGRAGAWADRSRAARVSRPRAAPPSMTTRRRRPPGPPPRGRIGRFGLLGPSAIRPLSVDAGESGAGGHLDPERAPERAPGERVLEALEPAAGVCAAAGKQPSLRQHAGHRREADEL